MADDDQPWVESSRPHFGRDLWVHYLKKIELLHLRLTMRALGLHHVWSDEVEPRGIGRRTWGKAKKSDVADSFTYLYCYQEVYEERDYIRSARDARDGLIDTLRAQLASTEAQLAKAREALATLATVECTDAVGASTSRSAPDPEASQHDADLSREAAELRVTLAVERREREREHGWWKNIVNVTVELSSFGRPKKEKLEPHLRPLLNLVNRGVNQVNQQSIIANERPVTFASTLRTSTVGNGDAAGRRNGSSTASFLAITVGQQCCHGFSLHPDRRQAILPPIQAYHSGSSFSFPSIPFSLPCFLI
ncbi:hypothetical protein Taro_038044 [Colocasia esculenta]|uniref:Uncharacterized protein n=1 Tax=Colocasia esculenta TaxID=4460 RepID=A0A843WI21_COLES|nr:hypothetical protein [Colocasia esculenta]